MNNIMDGLLVSRDIKMQIKDMIISRSITPSLVVIQIGNNPASNVYIKNKEKACLEVGIKFDHIKFNEVVSEEVVINEIKRLNEDINVNGILVQLPLPLGFDEGKIINSINPLKDVDGLTYENVGNLVLSNECLKPCTAQGIMMLLDYYKVAIESKNVCIIGRSNLVGRPLIQMFLQENATVTVCHSKSLDIKRHSKMADILVVAAGHPNLVTEDMIKDDAIIVDVGINKEGNVLCGDVCFDEVSKKAKLITPTPGGVGPMTVVSLLKNVCKAYVIQNYE